MRAVLNAQVATTFCPSTSQAIGSPRIADVRSGATSCSSLLIQPVIARLAWRARVDGELLEPRLLAPVGYRELKRRGVLQKLRDPQREDVFAARAVFTAEEAE